MKNYYNFDLKIKKTQDLYSIEVDAPNTSGQAETKCKFSDSILSTNPFDDPKIFGPQLFNTIFKDGVKDALRRSLDKSKADNKGLRIRLRLNHVPELAQLPWEYLCNQEFLALSNNISIVRYIELAEPEPEPATISPLRILVMISQPMDLPALDVESEWQSLQEALSQQIANGQVKLKVLEEKEATLSALQSELRTGEYHVFHYIGHGVFDRHKQEAGLLLVNDNQRSNWVSPQNLSTLLGNHASLRLVYLNTCEGAKASQANLFSGMGQKLISYRLPAVIAMQSGINDHTAKTLAAVFYRGLADGYSVDSALVEARTSVSTQNNYEWGIPALFMRATDGNLFRFDETTPEGFFEPEIEGFQSSYPFLDKIAETICQSRLLILHGSQQELDMKDLARYIAWQISKTDNDAVFVLEWASGYEAETETLISELAKKVNYPAILIYHDTSRENIEHNFLLLREFALQKKHYLILTTNISEAAWKLNNEELRYWQELSQKDIYTEKIITNELKYKLLDPRYELPRAISRNKIKSNQIILEGLSLRKIAKKLSSPDEVTVFVHLLCTTNTTIETKDDVWNLIELAKNNESALKRRYSHLSSYQDQLLVLGFCLFDGLFETQFFLALEKVIEEAWSRSLPAIGILDYYHFDKLHPFFEATGNEERKLEGIFPNQREILLKIASQSHRRHILMALPVLVQIVKDSVNDEFHKEELYGNKNRRQQLRETISDAISYIGLNYFKFVEKILLELASGPNPNEDAHHFYQAAMQAVAANAMTKWYTNNEKQLFAVLQGWQGGSWKKAKVETDEVGIHLTIARTVNNLLREQAFDDLPPELCNLLFGLFRNSNRKVNNICIKNILQKIFPAHLEHLNLILFEMIGKSDQIVIDTLIKANQPNVVIHILKSWYEKLQSTEEKKRVRKSVVFVIVTVFIKLEIEITDNYEKIKFMIDVMENNFDIIFGDRSQITSQMKLDLAQMINQAILYNQFDTLPQNLHNLVKKLYGCSPHSQLGRFFDGSIFPAIFPRYQVQFKGILLDKAKQNEFSDKVVGILVSAYKKQPESAFETLDNWREGWNSSLKQNNMQKLASWAPALIVVARSYHQLGCFSKIEPWLLDFVVEDSPTNHSSTFAMKKAPTGRLNAFVMKKSPTGRLNAFVIKKPPEIIENVIIIAQRAIHENTSSILSENLIDFLTWSLKYNDQRFNQLFFDQILPDASFGYLEQLDTILFEVVEKNHRPETVIDILINVNRPKAVISLLRSWYTILQLGRKSSDWKKENSHNSIVILIVTVLVQLKVTTTEYDEKIKLMIDVMESDFDLIFDDRSQISPQMKLDLVRIINQAILDNKLNLLLPNLYYLVNKLYRCMSNSQLSRFFDDSIFLAIFPRYQAQFRDILLDKAKQNKSCDKVVGVLVSAYRRQPESVFETLDNWREGWDSSLKQNNTQELALWAPALIVVARSYYQMGCFSKIEPWLLDFVAEDLQTSNSNAFVMKKPPEIIEKIIVISKGAIRENASSPLSEDIINFLRQSLNYEDESYRQLFFREIVKEVSLHHLEKIEHILFYMANNTELDKIAIEIITDAYSQKDKAVLKILNSWRHRLQDAQMEKVEASKNLLTTVAIIYGKLDEFNEAKELLFSFFIQAEQQEQAEMALKTFAHINSSQRQSHINRDQNTNLQTRIEQEMVNWLTVESEKDKSRIALKTLIAFNRDNASNEAKYDIQEPIDLNRSLVAGLARLVEPFVEGNRSKKMMLVHEIIDQYKSYPAATSIALEKWELSDNLRLNDLAKILRAAIILAKQDKSIRLYLIILVSFSLFLSLVFVLFLAGF